MTVTERHSAFVEVKAFDALQKKTFITQLTHSEFVGQSCNTKGVCTDDCVKSITIVLEELDGIFHRVQDIMNGAPCPKNIQFRALFDAVINEEIIATQ